MVARGGVERGVDACAGGVAAGERRRGARDLFGGAKVRRRRRGVPSSSLRRLIFAVIARRRCLPPSDLRLQPPHSLAPTAPRIFASTIHRFPPPDLDAAASHLEPSRTIVRPPHSLAPTAPRIFASDRLGTSTPPPPTFSRAASSFDHRTARCSSGSQACRRTRPLDLPPWPRPPPLARAFSTSFTHTHGMSGQASILIPGHSIHLPARTQSPRRRAGGDDLHALVSPRSPAPLPLGP